MIIIASHEYCRELPEVYKLGLANALSTHNIEQGLISNDKPLPVIKRVRHRIHNDFDRLDFAVEKEGEKPQNIAFLLLDNCRSAYREVIQRLDNIVNRTYEGIDPHSLERPQYTREIIVA